MELPNCIKLDEKGKEVDIQPYKMIYDYVGLVATWFGITYTTMPFAFLFMEPTLDYYSKMQYSGHIAFVGLFILFSMVDMMGGKRKGPKEIKPE